MEYLKTHALVLRSVPYGDSSRMLTVLTASHGRVSAAARGAVRRGSKLLAAVQPFVFSEMTFAVSRERYTLTEAHIVEQFRELTEDLTAFALGTYFLELLEAVSDEDAPGTEILSLGLNALFALGENKRPKDIIKAAAELRLMCLAGYTPELSGCRVCGNADCVWLSHDGGLLCGDCGKTAGAYKSNIDAPSLAAMRYITSVEPKRLYAFRLDDGETLTKACEEYTLSQLGRGFKTLDYYKNYCQRTD